MSLPATSRGSSHRQWTSAGVCSSFTGSPRLTSFSLWSSAETLCSLAFLNSVSPSPAPPCCDSCSASPPSLNKAFALSSLALRSAASGAASSAGTAGACLPTKLAKNTSISSVSPFESSARLAPPAYAAAAAAFCSAPSRCSLVLASSGCCCAPPVFRDGSISSRASSFPTIRSFCARSLKSTLIFSYLSSSSFAFWAFSAFLSRTSWKKRSMASTWSGGRPM
mmetsp:Transcript_123339/g.349461  ORF Transcript_123339/g.349461 Transcript_123339/m.349461 type:complete len:223 (-) Transcript_123339:239-907(-)